MAKFFRVFSYDVSMTPVCYHIISDSRGNRKGANNELPPAPAPMFKVTVKSRGLCYNKSSPGKTSEPFDIKQIQAEYKMNDL